MFQLFAHNTGEPHVEPSTVDTMWVNVLPFAGLALILLVMTYGFKTKLSTRIVVAMTYLLVVGVGMFQLAPIASTIAIIIGFGLALGTMLLQAKR